MTTLENHGAQTMNTLGICCGASTIQAVLLHGDSTRADVVQSMRTPHDGDVGAAFLTMLASFTGAHTIDRICVTGRSFRHSLALASIAEPQAVSEALRASYPGRDFPQVLISAGGESQIAYEISHDGRVTTAHTGSKCAAGTGEFYLQQIRRMGLTLEESISLALKGSAHKIAGRCSVFCKSDCTHALNKGEPRENILAGLCRMMADKIGGLVRDPGTGYAAITGGQTMNLMMLGFLRERFTRLDVPDHATVFEAYGAALWAMGNQCLPLPADPAAIIRTTPASYGTHPPLTRSAPLVSFKTAAHATVSPGDSVVIGLDVGSTTTKALIIRQGDQAILASVYLRTNGNPVEASRRCYRELKTALAGVPVRIVGLGVTGSGRQIAALHALTGSVINEIIAHATAAVFYDPDVDTIFEIGGQDAKYTFLTAGVASDYAMNEACSAGTGSFLEESARESLGIATEAIADIAMTATVPPNFRDECAAFISSDIKKAGQEGIGRNDIVAGLVYSICQNYLNRVKGNRPVGRKIFMQGGVCYNQAVPLAMAALLDMPVIVPPDPGLVGAFGVALDTARKIATGETPAETFILDDLITRTAQHESPFICAGGAEKCDRKCEIARIRVNGTVYPFGGACNRYYNQRGIREVNTKELDLVALRQSLLLSVLTEAPLPDQPLRTIGLNRSFLSHSLLPLFNTFFTGLGLRVVISDNADEDGIARTESTYCLPAELSHGAFLNLLRKKPDYIFLPQVMQLPVPNALTHTRLCVFVQGEPYYLKSTFRDEIDSSGVTILSPVLRFEQGYEQSAALFAAIARDLGFPPDRAHQAYAAACARQRAFEQACRDAGLRALEYLDAHPDTFATVLFGRPYNAFAPDAHMGIPAKVASRGCMIIPHEMLPADDSPVDEKMFWANGQKILKAAHFVKQRSNLFGIFITNFSCGPDSFLLTFFRDIMEGKPSLTLELDQHTADAGIDTRIEAALEIMRTNFSRTNAPSPSPDAPFKSAHITAGDRIRVIASDGTQYDLRDPRVEVLMPPMGSYSVPAVAAIMRSLGINARALPTADRETLLEGRRHASCKECLPYLVIAGSFLTHLKKPRTPDTVTLLFIPTGGGPCRLGQYCKGFESLIRHARIPNVAVFTVTDENGYGGLGNRALLRAWKAMVTADIFEDMQSFLTVSALDTETALQTLDTCWQRVLAYFEGDRTIGFSSLLKQTARTLASIKLTRHLHETPTISLIGEYYVRKDEFSRMNILDYLHRHGFMVKVAPAMEYPLYGNYNVSNGLQEGVFTTRDRIVHRIRSGLQEWWERRIKTLLASSGLYKAEMTDIPAIIHQTRHLMDRNFRGECILTIGSALREIASHSCGVIAIGPFGCMPSRMAEAILKKEMNVRGLRRIPGGGERTAGFNDDDVFPFLSIETDGNPFPQVVEANLEAFVLQARGVHEVMMGRG